MSTRRHQQSSTSQWQPGFDEPTEVRAGLELYLCVEQQPFQCIWRWTEEAFSIEAFHCEVSPEPILKCPVRFVCCLKHDWAIFAFVKPVLTQEIKFSYIINRPSAAGEVLETPWSLMID